MMHNLQARLARCFAAVFPELSPDEVPRASMETVERWDSLASFSVISVVEEEFGIRVAPESMVRFVSFEGIADYLREQGL
jgi:acyl carrier protein